MSKVTTALVFLIFLVSHSLSAQNPAPCGSEEHRQFDFWIGKWDVYSTSADTIVGYSHIKQILNECVIEENWTGKSGIEGKSFNTYNPRDSTWNQVWVDASGARFEFSGRYHDNIMDLAGEVKGAKGKVLFTLRFHNQKATDTVRQVWEISKDNGENWTTIFDGTYKRRAKK